MTRQCTKDISGFVYVQTVEDHSVRVGEGLSILVETAMDMGYLDYSKDFISECKQAGVLHDIGKVYIDSSILNKPGILTQEEYSLVKLHTIYGASFIKSLIGEGCAYKAALTHHERWDGLGYPYGVCGESIPFIGRACAIVDAFDVIIHDRPYKKASSIEDGFYEILRCSGSHFDPTLVESFKMCYKRLK